MKRTQRELHIALGSLLQRVKLSSDWSSESFKTISKKINNITPAEATKFHKTLVEQGYLVFNPNIGKFSPRINTSIWKDTDIKLRFVAEILRSIKGRKPRVSSFQEVISELKQKGYKIVK